MPATEFDRRAVVAEGYKEEVLIDLLVGESLQYKVWLAGLVYHEHAVLATEPHHRIWVRSFAYLALELGEVVLVYDSVRLFVHLSLNPAAQASHMHKGTTSAAKARRDQKIFAFLVLA